MGSFDWGNSSNWNSAKELRISDLVDMLDLSDGEWHTCRMIGGSVVHKVHWITIKTKTGKVTRIPKKCLGFDPNKPEGHSGVECPYCSELSHNPSTEVYVNVIERDIQADAPRKPKPPTKYEMKRREWNGGEWLMKETRGSGGWTAARVLRATSSLGTKIGELTSLNSRKIKGKKKKFSPDHPKFGFDIILKYDKDCKTPANAYSVQKGDNTALEEEDLDMLLWNIPPHEAEKPEVAKKEAAKLLKVACDNTGNLLFAESGGDKKKKKKNEYADSFDDDDDYEDDDRPAKKSKSKKRRDDDDEDEDDDDDDRPAKKSKSSKKSSWDDDDEDDDEEDERPKKKSSKSKRRDDDDDDEDERPAKKSKKSSWDDDDDDDDDEEERPVKKSKSKSKTSSKSKRRRDDDDDDDYDDD